MTLIQKNFNKKKNLYLPVEIKVREFLHKIYLSFEASKRGYRSYIGSKSDIFQLISQKKNKGGVFFPKGGITDQSIGLIKKKCDLHAVFDEEMNKSMQNYLSKGSILNFYKHIIKCRYNNLNLKSMDRYYCFNNGIYKAAKLIFNKKKCKPILLPGHFKEDLLKNNNLKIYEKKRKIILKDYGDFILFNSDFSYLSNVEKGINDYTLLIKELVGETNIAKREIKFFNKFAIYKYNSMLYFLSFLKQIDKKLVNLKMMIRPHPRESIDDWKKIVKEFKNIFIVSPEEDVTAYILAARGVMHNGCSTAISALLLGKPTAYFLIENILSNKKFVQEDILKSCIKITNPENFYAWLQLLKKNSKDYLKKNEYLKNFKKQKLSSRIILDNLDKSIINKENKIEIIIKKKQIIYYIIKYLVSLKFLKKFPLEKKLKIPSKIKDGIKKNDAEQYLRVLEKINGIRKKTKVRQLSDNLIEIS